MNRYVSEMIGTMILVLMGCGSAVFAGDIPGKNSTSASHQNKDHCPDHFRYIPVHSISNYV